MNGVESRKGQKGQAGGMVKDQKNQVDRGDVGVDLNQRMKTIEIKLLAE